MAFAENSGSAAHLRGVWKVKNDQGEWGSLIKYFQKNADFLSHGYCDDCGEKQMAEVEEYKRKKAADKLAVEGENGRS